MLIIAHLYDETGNILNTLLTFKLNQQMGDYRNDMNSEK